jgi:hypothetical protein
MGWKLLLEEGLEVGDRRVGGRVYPVVPGEGESWGV